MLTPYPTASPYEAQRSMAAAADAVWVYDYLPLIDKAHVVRVCCN